MAAIDELFDKDIPEIALKSLFIKYDEDNDGTLDIKELSKLLKNDFGLDREQAEVYSYILDKDGDGRISFNEFVAWTRSEEKLLNIRDQTRYYYLQRAVEYFQRYDIDNSLSLDKNEVRALLLEVGGSEENLQDAMDKLDSDKNGIVSFQEFLNWLNWAPLKDLFGSNTL